MVRFATMYLLKYIKTFLGKCRTEHERITVLYHRQPYTASRWETRCFWRSHQGQVPRYVSHFQLLRIHLPDDLLQKYVRSKTTRPRMVMSRRHQSSSLHVVFFLRMTHPSRNLLLQMATRTKIIQMMRIKMCKTLRSLWTLPRQSGKSEIGCLKKGKSTWLYRNIKVSKPASASLDNP